MEVTPENWDSRGTELCPAPTVPDQPLRLGPAQPRDGRIRLIIRASVRHGNTAREPITGDEVGPVTASNA